MAVGTAPQALQGGGHRPADSVRRPVLRGGTSLPLCCVHTGIAMQGSAGDSCWRLRGARQHDSVACHRQRGVHAAVAANTCHTTARHSTHSRRSTSRSNARASAAADVLRPTDARAFRCRAVGMMNPVLTANGQLRRRPRHRRVSYGPHVCRGQPQRRPDTRADLCVHDRLCCVPWAVPRGTVLHAAGQEDQTCTRFEAAQTMSRSLHSQTLPRDLARTNTLKAFGTWR